MHAVGWFWSSFHLDRVMQKCVLCHMRPTKVQISLRMDCAFVVRCSDSMICILAISKVWRYYLVSVAVHTGFNLTWSKIPEDTFSRDVALLIGIMILIYQFFCLITSSWRSVCSLWPVKLQWHLFSGRRPNQMCMSFRLYYRTRQPDMHR